MYAYLIIAAELAILYSVFWYVFIREPRPYTLKGDLWGTYPQSAYTTYDDHESEEAVQQIQSGLNKNRTHLTRLPMKPIEDTKQYGWVVRDRDAEAGAVANLFGKFRSSVETMSVKVPY